MAKIQKETISMQKKPSKSDDIKALSPSAFGKHLIFWILKKKQKKIWRMSDFYKECGTLCRMFLALHKIFLKILFCTIDLVARMV
jgi:hypothetical protein